MMLSRIFFSIILPGFYLSQHAQNVGISTTTPQTNLDIQSIGSTGTAGQIRLNAPNLAAGNITAIAQGKNAGSGNQAEWRFDYFGNNNGNNAHTFGFSNIQPFVAFKSKSRYWYINTN